MALRTWTLLTPEEHARRRGLLRTVLIGQAVGLTLGGLAGTLGGLMAPSPVIQFSNFPPFLGALASWLVYRWSARHWYPTMYFYLITSAIVIVSGLYQLGGATGPMGVFFLWIILIGGMLVDLRASVEMAGLSILLYGIFAVGVPLGWIKLPQAPYADIAPYMFPTFFAMMFALMAFLTWLFGGSLNTALDQTRQLASSLEEEARQRAEANRQLSDSNSQLQDLAGRYQRRAMQLQAAAGISSAATQVMDPNELLPRVVELICQQFGLYYVGLFLLDESHHYAVLHAGTGEAGRTMKERGHRLEVGSQSMVGWVCANKQARIALDVGNEPVRFANPLLPDTHSEMALPLRIGERVLGALDVQSTQAAAFDESDVAVLQSMADQVAVALENARLFQQTQTALKDLEATNRLLTRQGWQEYLGEAKATRRAEFRVAGLPGSEAESLSGLLTVPLELRGHSLGRLALRREGDRSWSEEDIQMVRTVVLQTALAADNARLFEATQGALDESRALYDSSRQITAAGEMSEVLSAVLDNLARTGIHAAAIALFDAPTREQAKHIELVGTWDYKGTPRLAPGVRFAIADFPLFNRITSEETLVSSDLLADPEIDDMARTVLGGLGLRAMAVTPLVARGQWIGVLFALVEQPHTFTPAEINFQRALADQAAVAIDSRRLFADVQRRAEREALVRQITTRIRAAGDIQGVLETTAAELARSMGVSRAIVRLTMGDDRGME
jgi:GAF domain-containing protein